MRRAGIDQDQRRLLLLRIATLLQRSADDFQSPTDSESPAAEETLQLIDIWRNKLDAAGRSELLAHARELAAKSSKRLR